MEQREIKFRAWLPVDERMIEEPYYFSKAQSPDDHVGPYVCYEDWRDLEDGRGLICFIMQFTGLSDKNGKEIYEGDLVKCFDHPTGVDSATGEVYYSQGTWRVKDTICPLADFGTAWTEVIGNIYESPLNR